MRILIALTLCLGLFAMEDTKDDTDKKHVGIDAGIVEPALLDRDVEKSEIVSLNDKKSVKVLESLRNDFDSKSKKPTEQKKDIFKSHWWTNVAPYLGFSGYDVENGCMIVKEENKEEPVKEKVCGINFLEKGEHPTLNVEYCSHDFREIFKLTLYYDPSTLSLSFGEGHDDLVSITKDQKIDDLFLKLQSCKAMPDYVYYFNEFKKDHSEKSLAISVLEKATKLAAISEQLYENWRNMDFLDWENDQDLFSEKYKKIRKERKQFIREQTELFDFGSFNSAEEVSKHVQNIFEKMSVGFTGFYERVSSFPQRWYPFGLIFSVDQSLSYGAYRNYFEKRRVLFDAHYESRKANDDLHSKIKSFKKEDAELLKSYIIEFFAKNDSAYEKTIVNVVRDSLILYQSLIAESVADVYEILGNVGIEKTYNLKIFDRSVKNLFKIIHKRFDDIKSFYD